jgi:hypothetical protein
METPKSSLPVVTGSVTQSKMQIGFCSAANYQGIDLIIFGQTRDSLGLIFAQLLKREMSPNRVYPVVIAQAEYFTEVKQASSNLQIAEQKLKDGKLL